MKAVPRGPAPSSTPATRSRSSRADGEEIVMDAAHSCRILAGRPSPDGGQPSGLLATQVPF
jgi:hypothetical protein